MTIPFAFGIAALITGSPRRFVAARGAALDDGGMAVPVVRPDARDVVGVRGARVGRVLGLGSGRERRTAALVHRDSVSALGHGAGAPRHAARVERHARDRHVLPDHLRHVHDPFGRRAVGARVRRGSRARVDVHDLHGRDPHLQLRAGHLPVAAAAVPSRARFVGVPRSGVPGQQLDPVVLGVLRAVRDDVPDAERSAATGSV